MFSDQISFIKNAMLRGLIGVAQVVTVLFLARELSTTALGLFNLLVILTDFSRLLVGFNFYVFLMREMSISKSTEWPSFLWQFAGFQSGTSLVFIIIIGCLYSLEVFSADLLVYVCLSVLAGVANVGLENYLISAGFNLIATLNVLIRRSWIIGVLIFQLFAPKDIDFELVVQFWILGEYMAACLALIQTNRKGLLPNILPKLDKDWVFRGVRVGAKYTIVALLTALILNSSRLVLGAMENLVGVGVFFFYYALTMALPNLAESALLSVYLPKILKLGQQGQILQLKRLLSLCGGALIICVAISTILIYMLTPHLLHYIDKPEISAGEDLLGVFIFLPFVHMVARTFYYYIYATGYDWIIVFSTAASAVVAVISSIFLIHVYGLIGGAWAFVLANLVLAVGYIAFTARSFSKKHVGSDGV